MALQQGRACLGTKCGYYVFAPGRHGKTEFHLKKGYVEGIEENVTEITMRYGALGIKRAPRYVVLEELNERRDMVLEELSAEICDARRIE
ncbi:unnamed protein product [Thelazia callipaeda]|uniref:Recombinase domain-containing protein n=1 Tax=Thelazia callipaeda TaxID=103827 RepID=A0A0N5D0D2_THECL|nr:unnamed protein product [Thelazia callipaeda]